MAKQWPRLSNARARRPWSEEARCILDSYGKCDWKDGGTAKDRELAREGKTSELALRHIPLAVRIAQGHRGRLISDEDLICYAVAGLFVAATSWQPAHTSGAGFGTYACISIMGAIRNAIRLQPLIAVPRTEPSDSGMSVFPGLLDGDVPAYRRKTGTDAYEDRDMVERLQKELSSRERKVVRLYFGLGGGSTHSTRQIGRLMSKPVSHTVVCGILSSAMEKMRCAVMREKISGTAQEVQAVTAAARCIAE